MQISGHVKQKVETNVVPLYLNFHIYFYFLHRARAVSSLHILNVLPSVNIEFWYKLFFWMRNYILIYIATPITLLGKPLQTSLVRIFLKLTTLEFLYDYIITFIHHKGSKKRIRWWLDVRPPHMQQHYIATCNPSDGLLIVSHSGSVVTHYQAILFAVVTARAITIILKLSKIICKAPKSYRYTKKLPTNKTFFVRRDLQSAEIG